MISKFGLELLILRAEDQYNKGGLVCLVDCPWSYDQQDAKDIVYSFCSFLPPPFPPLALLIVVALSPWPSLHTFVKLSSCLI